MALCVLQSPSLTSDGIANSFGNAKEVNKKPSIHDSQIHTKSLPSFRSNMADMEAQEAHGPWSLWAFCAFRSLWALRAPRPFTPRRRVEACGGNHLSDSTCNEAFSSFIRTDETFGTGKVQNIKSDLFLNFWLIFPYSCSQSQGRCLRF